MSDRKKLGEILIEQNILCLKTVERMLCISQKANKRLGTVLEDMGLITDEELARALAMQHKLRTIFNFSKAYFSPELLRIITADTALKHLIFPLKQDKDKLGIAVFDPDNLKILRNIGANNSLTVIPYVSSRKEIKAAIYRHYFRAETIEPVRRTILIVDDDHMVLERLDKILARHYKVFSAKNGMDGYKEAVTKKPHVILTDKEMPKLDGFGLLNAVQSMPETQGIPVILLSGATSAELESKAFKSGFFDFMQKPIKETTVLTRVKRAFDFYEQHSYSTEAFSTHR